jgi:sortase A
VLSPVPCDPGAACAFGQTGGAPTKRLLTFTTCNPKYSASQRLIVFGQLASSQPLSRGLPPALAGETS